MVQNIRKIIPYVLLGIITASGLFYYDYTVRKSKQSGTKESSQYPTNSGITNQNTDVRKQNTMTFDDLRKKGLISDIVSVPVTQIEEGGWIPYYDFNDGLESLKTNSDKLSSISPVWYEVNTDGSLNNKRNSNYKSLTSYAKTNGIKVIPSIANFDHEIMSEVLANEENFNRHIKQIHDVVIVNNYDGIDLDYESIETEVGDEFMEMVRQLSEKLHADGKLLSVTVISEWGEDIEYTSLPQTREVLNWKEIAKYADQVRIMAYDYTALNSAEPGPIAPISWVENILAYAATEIPREKTILGIPLYSYEWASNGEMRAYNFDTVSELLQHEGVEAVFNDTYKEGYATYQCTEVVDVSCVLYYQNQQSVTARKDLAAKFGIKGVYYWKLGNDADILEELAP